MHPGTSAPAPAGRTRTWRLPGAARRAALAVVAMVGLAPPAASQQRLPYHPGIDVVHYDLTLELPARGNVIQGRAVLTVRRTAPVDTLRLDLLLLRVDSVLVDGAPRAFRRDSACLHVPLDRAGPDTVTVVVRYGGAVRDGLIVTDSAGPWRAFGDNWPDRARHWIPSVDHPGDKATVAWSVRAPSELRVVANGALLEETPLDGRPGTPPRRLTRWRTERPLPTYLMVIAAAPLAFYDLGSSACGSSEFAGCVRQTAYYYSPSGREALPGALAEAGAITEHFASLIAPYPFEKLAHLQSSTRFGGMENASAIFYHDRTFRGTTPGRGLIAHETAHQWFGNSVTPADWPHLWLSEGFATYFAQLWTEHIAGDSAFRAGMAGMRDQIVRAAVVAQRPVIDSAQTELVRLLNANSYQKGGFVLHMLRGLVGDSAFFRGVRAYYDRHRHANATTDDLRAAMEAASGRELGWFFDQWLRRPGVAELEVSWRYDASRGRVILEVQQGVRFAPYRLPFTVDVADADGRTRRAVVEIPAARRARLELPLELTARPASIRFDPDVHLLGTITQP